MAAEAPPIAVSDPPERTGTVRPRAPRRVTFRSLLMGSLGVCLVCGLAPYNDYVVANSFIVGNYLPAIVVMAFFLLVVVVNAPLHRYAPSRAFTTPELAVILLMMLVACSIPGQGLLRAFLPTLVAPFYHGQSNTGFWNAFVSMELPAWLFPVDAIADGLNDPAVNWFYSRVPAGEPIPYANWIVPLAGWGIFIAAMLAVQVALAVILREQWARNERLAFPLAQLQLSLIAPPAPGRAFNDLFGSRAFWIACGGVFFLEGLTALHQYIDRVPEIPLSYNLREIFAEEPWIYLSNGIRANKIFFTFLGVMYFVPSRVGFSIWFIYLVAQFYGAAQATAFKVEIPGGAWYDQHLGAGVAWVGGMLWIGRRQWIKVLRHMVQGPAERETVSYRWPAITFFAALVVMAGWLLVLGVRPLMVGIILSTMLLAHLIVARAVAETGLPIFRSVVTPGQLYTLASPAMFGGRDLFFASVFTSLGAFTTRESALTFSMQGLQTADDAAPSASRGPLLGAVAWALLLGFVVACASSLYCYYHFATPLTTQLNDSFINQHGLIDLPRQSIIDPVTTHVQGRFPSQRHDSLLHMSIGLVIMICLQVGAMRFVAWPLAPVGYLVATMPFVSWFWWSAFLGWLAKSMIVRFGGADLYRAARPLFVGLIFGEALATGFWLAVNLVLVALGQEYVPIRFLPT